LTSHFDSIEHVVTELADAHYIADRALATVLFLAHRLEKPIFLEGEPGVGKTEVAIVMSRLFKTDLIRLQCYEDSTPPRPYMNGIIPNNFYT